MVKVTFKPIKEIVIHETIEHELKDLTTMRVLGLRKEAVAQPLIWAEGIVMIRSGLPPTDDIVKDQLEGIIHFGAIEWAPMLQFKQSLKSEGVTIPVINGSHNPNMKAIARALKSQKKH